MGRTLVTSDIHGCYLEFNELLKKANYSPFNDKLILLGDYVDRGPFSKKVIAQLIGMTMNGVVALRGNHDQMFLDALDGIDDTTFIYNGGMSTIESYTGETLLDMVAYEEAKEYIIKNYAHHIRFLRNLPYYHEDDDHIYVHAGLNPFYNDFDWTTQKVDNFLWIRELFLNNATSVSKTIIHGHTPTPNFQETGDIIFSDGKINIDGGGVFGDQFNLLAIEEDGSYTEYFLKGKRYL